MKLKPIVWSEPKPPTKDVCCYDHCRASTPLGEFSVEWKSWKQYDSYCVYFNGDYLESVFDLEDAKDWVDKYYKDLIMSCFEEGV